MKWILTLIFISTLSTNIYLIIMFFSYMLGVHPADDEIQEDDKKIKTLLIIPMISSNINNIESCLHSIIKSYKPDDLLDIVVVAKHLNSYETSRIMNFGVGIFEVEGPYVSTRSYLLDCAFATYTNYDFYIIVDSFTVIKKGLIIDMIHAHKLGYDVVQGSVFIKEKNSYMEAITNLYLLVIQGFVPKAKSNLNMSSGIFGNNFGISREIIEKRRYSSSSVLEDNKYHAGLIKEGYRVKFIEELKAYSEYDYNDTGVLMLKRVCGLFYTDLEYFKCILRGIFSRDFKEFLILFFESTSLPNCYYIIINLLFLFTKPYRYYSIYSLFVLFFIVFISIYRFGDDRDLFGLVYLPKYLFCTMGRIIKSIFLIPVKVFLKTI